MVTFKKIILNNFGVFKGKHELIITDDTDVTFINGLNKDNVTSESSSNGSGKTFLFQSILFCLFGKVSKQIKIDNVVNNKENKNCYVGLEIEYDNHIYKLVRYRKDEKYKNDFYIYCDGKKVSKKNVKDSQSLVKDIFGFNYELFKLSVHVDKSFYFFKLTDAKRMELFESIINVDIINDIKDYCKKELSGLEHDFSKIEGQLQIQKQNIINGKSQIQKIKEKKENEINTLKSKIELVNTKLKKYSSVNIEEEKQKKIDQQIFIEQLKYVNDDLKSIQSQIDEIDLKSLEKELKKYPSINIEEEKKKHLRHQELYAEVAGHSLSLTFIEDKMNTIDYHEKVHNNIIHEREIKIKQLALLKENKCPFCLRELHDDEKISILENEISILDNTLKIEDEKKVEYDKAWNEYLKEMGITNKFRKELDDIKLIDITRYEKLMYEYNEKKSYHDKTLERYNMRKMNKDEIERNFNLIKIIDIDEFESLTTEINKLNHNLDILLRQYESDDSVKIIEDQIKIDEIQIKENENTLLNKKNDIDHYQFLSKLFSKDLKKYIFDKYLTIFNYQLSYYVKLFFGDMVSIRINDILTEEIIYDGKEVDFGYFSSGESSKIELCFMLAFSFLIRNMFFNTNLFIIDEALDESFDQTSLNIILDIIKSLNLKTYVISHREYDSKNNILILKENGESTIHGL